MVVLRSLKDWFLVRFLIETWFFFQLACDRKLTGKINRGEHLYFSTKSHPRPTYHSKFETINYSIWNSTKLPFWVYLIRIKKTAFLNDFPPYNSLALLHHLAVLQVPVYTRSIRNHSTYKRHRFPPISKVIMVVCFAHLTNCCWIFQKIK